MAVSPQLVLFPEQVRALFVTRITRRSEDAESAFSRFRITLTLPLVGRSPPPPKTIPMAWSMQSRRAPSWYCRDARVYGHACYDYPPPPTPNVYQVLSTASNPTGSGLDLSLYRRRPPSGPF